jgi:26S proteasome regulatory subunit T2
VRIEAGAARGVLLTVSGRRAPSIVFIDEIDAVGTKRCVVDPWVPRTLCSPPCSHHRYDSSSGGEREIQRTLLELLNQLDGFDTRHDVKVIMATNRIESLDPALIRPG